jgi:large repetitive protein
VTDADGVSVSKSLTMTVNTPPTITTSSPLPGGTHGSAYSTTIAATNGTPTLTFSLTGGSLGSLTLSPSGLISGTQTSSGTYSFTVTVTDANGVVSMSKAFAVTFT